MAIPQKFRNLSPVSTGTPQTEEATFGSHFVAESPVMAGAGAGAAMGLKATAAIPHPLVKGGAALVGGLVGGVVGAIGKEKVLDVLPDSVRGYLQEGEEQNPLSARAGEVSSAAVGFGLPGMASKAVMGTGAAIGGAVGAGEQYLTTGEVDPGKLAIDIAGGALFTKSKGTFGYVEGKLGGKDTKIAELEDHLTTTLGATEAKKVARKTAAVVTQIDKAVKDFDLLQEKRRGYLGAGSKLKSGNITVNTVEKIINMTPEIQAIKSKADAGDELLPKEQKIIDFFNRTLEVPEVAGTLRVIGNRVAENLPEHPIAQLHADQKKAAEMEAAFSAKKPVVSKEEAFQQDELQKAQELDVLKEREQLLGDQLTEPPTPTQGTVPVEPMQKPLGGVGKAGFGQGGAFTPWSSSEQSKTIEGLATGSKEAVAKVGEMASYVGEAVSNKLNFINEGLARRTQDVWRNTLSKSHKQISAADPFIDWFHSLPSEKSQKMITNALMNGNLDGVARALPDDATKQSFQQVRQTLDNLKKEAAARGIINQGIEDYFPRLVKDYKGLLGKLKVEEKSNIEDAWTAKKKVLGRELTEDERSDVVNKYLRGVGVTAFKPSFAKERKLANVDEDLQDFYYSPAEALHSYIQRMTHEIEVYDFFGRGAAVKNGAVDIEDSVGAYVKQLQESGELSPEKASEVKQLLDASFRAGRQSPNQWVQHWSNVETALTLGNVVSAAMSVADLIPSVVNYGLKPTVKSLMGKMTGDQKLSTKDYGLLDSISEEFANQAASQRFTNRVMKASGWSILDSFGKDVQFNASLIRNAGLAKTPAGVAKLQKQYAEALGDELPQYIKDLQSGEASDLVKSVSFWEVAKHQPLTMLQRSEGGMRHPNMRAFMGKFKSYMMMQANWAKNKSLDTYRKGVLKNDDELKRRGIEGLMKVGAGLAVTGVANTQIQNFMLGRDEEVSWDDVVTGAFRQIGYNEYAMDKLKEGKPIEAAGTFFMPPQGSLKTAQALSGATGLTELVTGEERSLKDSEKDEYQIKRAFPAIGRQWAETSEYGTKKFEDRERKKMLEELKQE